MITIFHDIFKNILSVLLCIFVAEVPEASDLCVNVYTRTVFPTHSKDKILFTYGDGNSSVTAGSIKTVMADSLGLDWRSSLTATIRYDNVSKM